MKRMEHQVPTYVIEATQWERGWEVLVPGIGVTQVASLTSAYAQARDFIETMTGTQIPSSSMTLVVR